MAEIASVIFRSRKKCPVFCAKTKQKIGANSLLSVVEKNISQKAP